MHRFVIPRNDAFLKCYTTHVYGFYTCNEYSIFILSVIHSYRWLVPWQILATSLESSSQRNLGTADRAATPCRERQGILQMLVLRYNGCQSYLHRPIAWKHRSSEYELYKYLYVYVCVSDSRVQVKKCVDPFLLAAPKQGCRSGARANAEPLSPTNPVKLSECTGIMN